MLRFMNKQKWSFILLSTLILFLGSQGYLEAAGSRIQAKYVFIFIGDGMGVAQRNAAENYLASIKGLKRPEEARLVMNTFPAQGMNTTYDLTSIIPDSASTATAISTGFKTKSGVIAMDPEGKTPYSTIAEIAKKKGWKVGIVTTVSLDHATPAAFYAHVPSRNQMYEISLQLANSGFDFFGGGKLFQPEDKNDKSKPNALEVAKKNGYTIITGRKGFNTLHKGQGKIIAVNELVDKDGAMYYTLDQNGSPDHVTLAEFVEKGISLLTNPKGFLFMIESGKIDWACHANDAAASIHDTLALDAAVTKAVAFYKKHPKDTLIIVTGDHETGGMTIGFAGTQYAYFVEKIKNQKMSYIQFTQKLQAYKKEHTLQNAKLEDLLPLIKEAFGLYVLPAEEKAALQKAVAEGKAEGASETVKKAAREAEKILKYSLALSDREIKVLQEAFKQSMLDKKEPAADEITYLHYGGYEPLAVKLTTILNNKAGIGWTSYSHTGVPVQTSALGVGAALFNGYYDQTDIHRKLMQISGLGK